MQRCAARGSPRSNAYYRRSNVMLEGERTCKDVLEGEFNVARVQSGRLDEGQVVFTCSEAVSFSFLLSVLESFGTYSQTASPPQ